MLRILIAQVLSKLTIVLQCLAQFTQVEIIIFNNIYLTGIDPSVGVINNPVIFVVSQLKVTYSIDLI